MTYDTACQIYRGIEAAKSPELKTALIRAAIRYARIRTDWNLATFEERRGMDQRRQSAHDAFIDACNILSREMARRGEDTSWRELLGHDRRTIGDFACYVHCLLGLSAR